jgi:hypothetical protein
MVYPILPRGQADRWGFVPALGVHGVPAVGRPILQAAWRTVTGRTDLRYKRDRGSSVEGGELERRFDEAALGR